MLSCIYCQQRAVILILVCLRDWMKNSCNSCLVAVGLRDSCFVSWSTTEKITHFWSFCVFNRN